jgi:hypothetical protein
MSCAWCADLTRATLGTGRGKLESLPSVPAPGQRWVRFFELSPEGVRRASVICSFCERVTRQGVLL